MESATRSLSVREVSTWCRRLGIAYPKRPRAGTRIMLGPTCYYLVVDTIAHLRYWKRTWFSMGA